ncbi:major facilitator superfamily transporter [Plectosphaerella cucumerina]|uniref:Major facilitator superfamily transporter n=1 Tax=Plectosphaerella cucumerina TaxID=40658 RepID=A0A8K0TFQ4_9PEZI|nr:major facilitator superfamily transporter [Plectosphaerella cucumerina]
MSDITWPLGRPKSPIVLISELATAAQPPVKKTRWAPLPPREAPRQSAFLPRSSWMRRNSREPPVPARMSRFARRSRVSWYPAAAAEMDDLFNSRTILPPRWTFYVPDFEYDIDAVSDSDTESTAEELKAFRVDFLAGDPRNPQNWSTAYRVLVTVMFAYTTLSTGIYSTSYASGIPQMVGELGVTDASVPLLGISLYLVGLALGALFMAPLSETFGRRPMYIGGLSAFLALIPVAALATDIMTILVARFLGAVAGSVMLSNTGGSIADITAPKYLPLALSVISFGPLNGPVLGPLLGGFVVEAWGWRWLNWLSLISTAVGAIFIMTVPETYRPALLRKLAVTRRMSRDDPRYWSDFDTKVGLLRRVRTAISRPFVLSFTEPVLFLWNVYISVIYAVVQLAYVAFPIIYQDGRGFSVAISGLAYIGVFVGISLVLVTEPLLRRLVNMHPRNPATGRPEPEATVLIICIGAVMEPLAQFMFAFTALPKEIPVYWSVASGIPFGYGFGLVFIYGTSYIASVFGLYATSASAGNLVFRSIFGAVLVLVGKAMYAALTPRGAGITLGVIEAALLPIPLAFYKWGGGMRRRSKLIRTLEAK